MSDESDWTMQMEQDGEVFPFVEDENANITGLGHQDREQFAAAVNRYDAYCMGEPANEDDLWTPDHIGHTWAVYAPDGESLYVQQDGKRVTSETPGAIAVTTLWGQR